ncbi:MAG: PleD family two-component system response regulator [Candidatus Methylomirabilales bacterium]
MDHNTEEIVVIPPEKGERTRVILVDDHPLFLRFLAHFFRHGEYELLTAESGEKAVEQARQLQPDLIVLDLEMPGLDGIETCQILRADETTRHIPVIILTASESLEVNRKAFGAGAQATVLKSMSREQLMNVVEITLKSKKIADSR